MIQKTKLISFQLIFIIFFLFFFHQISTNNTPFQFQQILYPNDPTDYIWFGETVSISGNSLAIASVNDLGFPYTRNGRVYILENENYNNNNNWNQKTRLSINDGTNGDGFGTSISISNDIVVVGAPLMTVGSNTYQGKAYIFKKNGTDWNQVAELIANDGEAEDLFGYRVFISGKIIIVGSPIVNINGKLNQGCAYVFNGNEDGTNWNQTQKLIASDGEEYDQFGWSVSISNDILVVGTPWTEVGTNIQQGKAYIFQNNGNEWNQIQILTAGDGKVGDYFGYSVSISSDSSLIIIGASEATSGSNIYQGKAYIFQKNGNQWNQIQILTADDGQEYDQFGYSVSISSDSSLIIIGAHLARVGSNQGQGKAYIFQKNGNQWNQIQILIANDGNVNDQFGTSVLISNQFAIVGASKAYNNNCEFIQAGKVYVFDNNPLPSPYPSTTLSISSSPKTTVIVS